MSDSDSCDEWHTLDWDRDDLFDLPARAPADGGNPGKPVRSEPLDPALNPAFMDAYRAQRRAEFAKFIKNSAPDAKMATTEMAAAVDHLRATLDPTIPTVPQPAPRPAQNNLQLDRLADSPAQCVPTVPFSMNRVDSDDTELDHGDVYERIAFARYVDSEDGTAAGLAAASQAAAVESAGSKPFVGGDCAARYVTVTGVAGDGGAPPRGDNPATCAEIFNRQVNDGRTDDGDDNDALLNFSGIEIEYAPRVAETADGVAETADGAAETADGVAVSAGRIAEAAATQRRARMCQLIQTLAVRENELHQLFAQIDELQSDIARLKSTL
jgi:hypothetical protein